ncbi:unnamed protein product, partial [Tilletia controversa]
MAYTHCRISRGAPTAVVRMSGSSRQNQGAKTREAIISGRPPEKREFVNATFNRA